MDFIHNSCIHILEGKTKAKYFKLICPPNSKKKKKKKKKKEEYCYWRNSNINIFFFLEERIVKDFVVKSYGKKKKVFLFNFCFCYIFHILTCISLGM